MKGKTKEETIYLYICIDIIVTFLTIALPVLALLSFHLPPAKAEVNSMWHILTVSLWEVPQYPPGM